MTAKSVQLTRFVNRQEELVLVHKKFQVIINGDRNYDFMLTVSGIPGIGKTTLLDKIREDAEAQNIRTVFVNCRRAIRSADEQWAILETIADDLFASDASWQEALQNYRENEGHAVQVFYHDQLLETFVENLRVWLANNPLVLLLDDVHYMGEPPQELLEEVLERTYDLNRLFVILAGRADLRWRSFQLRSRTRNILLEQFKEEEAVQLLKEPANPDLSKAVYRLTRGYPLASVRAYEWVADHFTLTDPDLTDQLKVQEADLVFDLVGSIFEDYILGHIDDAPKKRWLAWLLRSISPLRRFDDNLLRALLLALDATQFSQITTLETRSYTRQMAALTYLVKWDSARIAYALDLPMRQLLSLEMKFREQERLLKIHKFVKTWYQDAINEVTARDSSAPQSVIYLIEHIYHLAQYRQVKGETENLVKEIEAKIVRHYEGYYLRERVHFFEEFSSDEELATVLGPDYSSLVKLVEQQVERVSDS
jgi:hypothetical protein